MTQWLRFSHKNSTSIGTLDGDVITVYSGDMFNAPTPTDEKVNLGDVAVLTPCDPSKIVALWNNSRALAEKQELTKPEHPLFFIKTPNTHLPTGQAIKQPATYDGRVIYEAELGVVIGKECSNVTVEDAGNFVFGYTCVNDVTALSLLHADPSFPQWARAKNFDTFGVYGPVIDTDVDTSKLTIRAELNGRERQNYTTDDMFYSPLEIVSLISQDMTLLPGDIIACGTGPGALPMKSGATIDIIIDPIGRLSNPFE
ncbi:MAG: fumarylacetoacetate hydrolase family protein [Rhodospirillaceae bacterium]|nr:fumarylacetoacetate hydrolase family protein [Rhodospirillaceae bacterium]